MGAPGPDAKRRVGKMLIRTVRQLRERWEEALQALEADSAKVQGFFREADCAYTVSGCSLQ